MNEKILFIIPIIIIVIFCLWLWFFLFKYLFDIRKKFSTKTRNSLFPDIQKSTNLLITLSSSAIVLTFSIIQISKTSIVETNYLICSWVGFILCILTGVVIGIIGYIHKGYYVSIVPIGNKAIEDKNEQEMEYARTVLNKINLFEKILFICLYIQPIIFVISIYFLIWFAVKNL